MKEKNNLRNTYVMEIIQTHTLGLILAASNGQISSQTVLFPTLSSLYELTRMHGLGTYLSHVFIRFLAYQRQI